MAQLGKILPAMWETWVRSLGWEDPLKKGKATRSSVLAWRIIYSPWGRKELDMTEQLSLHFFSPMKIWVQSLGLEDPLKKEMATHSSILAGETPWTEEPGRATVHGVEKSQT